MSEQSHDSNSTNDTIHVDLNTAITIVVQNPPPVAEQQHQHQEQEQVFPRVRDHSYLPGTCHPRHTSFAASLSSSTSTTTNRGIRHKRAQYHELKELPIIEIPGVVLFPGSTLPIRLTSPAWMDYLGRKIQASRAMPGKQQQHDDMNNNDDVELGVLTFLTAQQQPDFDNGRPQRILQRRSWTRQGFGPVRLRRFSLQLQRELIREGWHNEDSSDDDSNHDESELQITDSEQEEEEEEEPLPVVQRRRFVGRIGTVATVTFTHGDNGSVTSPAATTTTTRQSRQLVLTALGTQRFWVPPNEHNERQEQTPGHADFGVKGLMVQLLDDDVPSLRDKYAYSVTNPLLHRNIPNALPIVTPFPKYLFKSYWPWSLQVEIRRLLEEISTFQDLAQHLSNLEQDENEFLFSESRPWSNPVDFTFWLSSNLPLKQEEKIHLIEMRSVVERLRYLKKKVSRERKMESRIHCRECGATLANVEHVFTVGGAEGTTGAYVNVHGSIIQTTTVRAIDEDCVTYYGFPQTLDSWFPGYAWTIMSCGFCHSHLGWKFTTVGKRKLNEAAPNRPDFFYGLAASSIDTYSNRVRRSISRSSRSNQR